jgi:uncharacterized protein YndB with AHSA1/START domain
MSTPESASPELADVVKTVTVPVPSAEAFRIFTEYPMDWVPQGHTYLKDAAQIAIEPGVGGRFFERNAAGAEAVHGVITEWAPPDRLVMTFRVGENWQPVDHDDDASLIIMAFTEIGPDSTEVTLTHSEMHRHGTAAAAIHALVDGPSPGETLARFANVVARQVASPQPSRD